MTLVRHRLTTPSGQPLRRWRITARLVAPAGLLADSTGQIIESTQAVADVDGWCELELTPQSKIAGIDTYYAVRVDGQSTPLYCVVPDAGPVQLAAILVDPGTLTPTPVPPASVFVLTGDPRLSDPRTPTLHAASHATDGSDPITPASIGAIPATQRQVPGRGMLVLCWDDAFGTDLSTVAPALEARDQRGSFFVPTSKIGVAGSLTAAGVKELYDRGHEIGCHGAANAPFPPMNRTQLDAEWAARAVLEGIVGVAGSVRSFAFPNGQHSDALDREAALRFDRVMITEGIREPWRQPIWDLRSHNAPRFQWLSSTHQQLLTAVRAAAVHPVVVTTYCHKIGSGGDITTAELLELLDLAYRLGIPCVTAAEAFANSSLLIDPGFEDPTLPGWVPFGANGTSRLVESAVDTPDVGLDGTRSLRLVNDGGSVDITQGIPVRPGETYTLSGRARTAFNTGGIAVTLTPRDAALTNLPAASTTVANASWTRFALDVTVPETATQLRVSLASNGNVGDGYVDHLWLAPKRHGAFG